MAVEERRPGVHVGDALPATAKPVGSFIQPLTEITMSDPRIPASTIGMPTARCARGDEAVPAVDVDGDEDRLDEEGEALDPEGRPNTAPNVAMKFGHSRPSSNDRIVPVTTPTANSTSITFDQRRASAR